jgi:hypothetical protein
VVAAAAAPAYCHPRVVQTALRLAWHCQKAKNFAWQQWRRL